MDTCSELPWTGCCYKASPPDLGELQAQGIWSENFSEEDKDQQEDQAASLGEEEEVQSEGHSEDTLHHLASRLSTKLKDRALLRGTSLAHVLEGLGKHLRSSALPAGNQVAEAIFQKSCPVTRIDYFISHCWSDSRSGKVFALWIHSNLNAAMVASSVVAAACTVLGRYRLLPVVAPRDLGFVFFPWALLLGGCCFFFVLGSWQRVLARLGRPVFYFLDKFCVHQTDLELKHAGVASFGAFVALSDRMLLLWSPAYFTRLWCMLEVSAMVKTSEHHAELPIEFVSLQLATLSFYLWATGFFVLAAVQVNTVVSKPLADVYFIGITVLIAAYFQMAAFRRYAFDRRSLEQQLRTFAVQQAECSDPKDRAMIEETIHSWFGDVEVCNRQIRETIGDKVMAFLGPARHYPTRMLVPILLIHVFTNVDYMAGSWYDDGTGWKLAGPLVGFGTWAMLMVPLSFRLCHCFVDRRRTRFRDSLLNCALAMVVTIGWLGGWYVNYFFVGFEMLPPWLSIPVLAAQPVN